MADTIAGLPAWMFALPPLDHRLECCWSLAHCLDRDDPVSLADEVRLAIEEPAEYARRFGQSRPVIPEPSSDLAKAQAVFLAGLRARGLVADVPRNVDAAAMLAALAPVAARVLPAGVLEAAADRKLLKKKPDAFVAGLAVALAPAGFGLFRFDWTCDPWPIAIAPLHLARRAQAPACGLGFRAQMVWDKAMGEVGRQTRAETAHRTAPMADAASGRLAGDGCGLAVMSSSVSQVSRWVDLSGWPPVLAPLADEWVRAAARGRDGRWVLLSRQWNPEARVRVVTGGQPAAAGRALRCPALEFTSAGFVGGRAVVLSDPMSGNTKSYSYMPRADLPHWEDGDDMVPVPGLPPLESCAADHCGVVQLDDGGDVLVWGGLGWELVGGRLEKKFPFQILHHDLLPASGVPAGPDGFWTVSGRELVLLRRGKAEPEDRVPGLKGRFTRVRRGPGGSIWGFPGPLFFFPGERTYVHVPKEFWPVEDGYAATWSPEHRAILMLGDQGRTMFLIPEEEVLSLPRARAPG